MVVATNKKTLVARFRKVYNHAYEYHINSISTNSSGEAYISVDDIRINMWNLEISDQYFNIVDIKRAIWRNLLR